MPMAAAKGIAPVPAKLGEENAQLAEVITGPERLANQHARLQRLEDDLLERAMNIVDGSMAFSEIDPADEQPPKEWIAEFGEEGARRRMRVARASWMNAKEAPVGIKVAAQVAVGIMRANAQKNTGPKVLNIAVVQMTAPLPQFEEREIEVGR